MSNSGEARNDYYNLRDVIFWVAMLAVPLGLATVLFIATALAYWPWAILIGGIVQLIWFGFLISFQRTFAIWTGSWGAVRTATQLAALGITSIAIGLALAAAQARNITPQPWLLINYPITAWAFSDALTNLTLKVHSNLRNALVSAIFFGSLVISLLAFS